MTDTQVYISLFGAISCPRAAPLPPPLKEWLEAKSSGYKEKRKKKKTRVLQLVLAWRAGIDWTRHTHDRIELSCNFSPGAAD